MIQKHLPFEFGSSFNTAIESPSTTPFVTPSASTSHSSGDESFKSIEEVTSTLRSTKLSDSKHVPTSKAPKATSSREITVASSTLSSASDDSDSSSSVEVVVDSSPPTKPEKPKTYAVPRSLKAKAAKMAERANFDYHMSLLSQDPSDGSASAQNGHTEQLKTTPLFAGSVMVSAGESSTAMFPQYGLLARRLKTYDDQPVDVFNENLTIGSSIDGPDPRIFLNVNAPWSAFLCGSQGSGKSHTLSCMLENSLLSSQLGVLPKPLTAIVFHYDKFTSFASSQICEAAYLCSSGIDVRVLVSPSNFWRMKRAYSNMPGLPANAKKPVVMPMLLKERHLDVERMMNLMAVTDKDGSSIPLYIAVYIRTSPMHWI